MKRMGGDQLGLDDAGLQDIVNRWRGQNPKICALWRRMQQAAVRTIRTGRTTCPREGVYFRKEITPECPFSVPDHAAAQRAQAVLRRSGTTEDDRITYKEWDYGHWSESETYGGKLTENLTQAVGRDCLAFALDNLRRANYRVVFHVHDEVVIEYPSRRTADTERALRNVIDIMSIVPLGRRVCP